MRRLLMSLLFLLTVLSLFSVSAIAAEKVSADAPVGMIKPHGNVILLLKGSEMRDAGYAFGDIVDVSFAGQTVTMPYCTGFSDVDSGCPVLVWRKDSDNHQIAINCGDFATEYGIAKKTADGWICEDGDTISVIITMNTPKGYYDEYVTRSLVYTDDRNDYPNLTDAEFANFREVTTSGIVPGMLYRGASPLDDTHNRAAITAEALETAGIRVILNLANSEESMRTFERYPDSYAGACVLALEMGMDFSRDDSMRKIAEGIRFLLQNEGPALIHCREGKDRTGFVCAALELLTGASPEEVFMDYMRSYENYYGIKESDESYRLVRASFEKTLRTILGDDLSAKDYLLDCGLTENELTLLIGRLTGE